MRDSRYVTVRQLRLLVAVTEALREVLGVTLFHNWERRGDDRFWFGIEEDVPGSPYVELVHSDTYGDDDWVGRTSDGDTFTVHGLMGEDGRAVYLSFQSMETSLAGRCYDVYSSLPEATRLELEHAWTRARVRDDLPVPRSWTWLLANDEPSPSA